jgi:hypothetical protein
MDHRKKTIKMIKLRSKIIKTRALVLLVMKKSHKQEEQKEGIKT